MLEPASGIYAGGEMIAAPIHPRRVGDRDPLCRTGGGFSRGTDNSRSSRPGGWHYWGMSRAPHDDPPHAGLFTRLYDPVLEPAERLGLGGLRRETLRGLSGGVLELGVGTGRSLTAYPASVSSVTGIDPDEAMLARAERRSRRSGPPARLLPAAAESLPFPDGSFDAVTAFLTLCTVRDQRAALGEARRVLAPGGELRLLEHVRLEREPLGWLQESLTPLWKRVAGGCHLDRRTLDAVRGAGFDIGRVERHLGGLVLRIYARRSA